MGKKLADHAAAIQVRTQAIENCGGRIAQWIAFSLAAPGSILGVPNGNLFSQYR